MNGDPFSLAAESTVITAFAFLLAVFILVSYTIAISKEKKKVLYIFLLSIFLLFWFFFILTLGRFNLFTIDPLVAPNIMLMFIVLFEILRRLYASETIKKIANTIPQHWLIVIQSYRIVGIGFLSWYAHGLLPAAFAFPAAFGDILVGLSAPFVAFSVYKKYSSSTRLAIVWNYIGILDLVIALGVGILAFSRPVLILTTTPTTELLSLYPLVMITLFAVPLALFLHAISLRTLKEKYLNKQALKK